MDVLTNVTIGFTVNVTAIKEPEKEDRTSRLDWVIPTIVNLVLTVITTFILASLIHYGLTSGKWRGQPTSQVDKLNAGVLYLFLIVCAVMCIGRYISNQIYMNVGFDYNNDSLCEAAGDAAFITYALMMWSVFMFLWFRQKAFYTNSMLGFKMTKCIRALSYSSIFLISAFALPFVVLSTIGKSLETTPAGCAVKIPAYKSNLIVYLAIYCVFLIVFLELLLFCLFIYPVLQIGKASKPLALQNCSSSITFFATKLHAEKRDITPNSTDSTSYAFFHQVSSSVVRQSDDKIKLIIQKTLFFAVTSILLNVILSIIMHFILPARSNRRYMSMIIDMAAFCNLLFLVLSFSTFKRMMTSFIQRSR